MNGTVNRAFGTSKTQLIYLYVVFIIIANSPFRRHSYDIPSDTHDPRFRSCVHAAIGRKPLEYDTMYRLSASFTNTRTGMQRVPNRDRNHHHVGKYRHIRAQRLSDVFHGCAFCMIRVAERRVVKSRVIDKEFDWRVS